VLRSKHQPKKTVFMEYCRELRQYCQERLDLHDPDLDDWIRRTRDACQTLIDVEEQLNGRSISDDTADAVTTLNPPPAFRGPSIPRSHYH
jgi:hypothetical protein